MPDEKSDKFTDEEVEIDDEEDLEQPLRDIGELNVYNLAYDVETVVKKISRNEIDLRPEFQRNFVWDIKTASKFIDSLIIGLPTPTIFLAKNKKDETFKVVDGQQRLKTLDTYLNEKKYLYRNKELQFKLTSLEETSSGWSDRKFTELDSILQRRLRNAPLNVTIIEYNEDIPELIFELFNRLNSKGVKLKEQEIRNGIYVGQFNKLLRYLNLNKRWRNLLGSDKEDARLNDVELILRFFALYYHLDAYSRPMKVFLSEFMKTNRNCEKYGEDELTELFEKTVEVIYDKIGPKAFRIERAINKSVFDSVMVGIAKAREKSSFNPEKIPEKHKLVMVYFKDYSMEGTTEKSKVKDRIENAIRLYAED